jgi:hypothetical protein
MQQSKFEMQPKIKTKPKVYNVASDHFQWKNYFIRRERHFPLRRGKAVKINGSILMRKM